MDKWEEQIIRQLQRNGRMSNVELAEKVGLSESPTFRRVKQLEERGLIQGYAAIVDQRRLGLEVTAFVQVIMEKQPHTTTEEFHACVVNEPHIVEKMQRYLDEARARFDPLRTGAAAEVFP